MVRLGRRVCGVSACRKVAIFGRVLPDGSYRRRCAVHKDTQDTELTRQSCSVAGCPRRSAGRTLAPGLGGHERLCLQHAHVSAGTSDRDHEQSHPARALSVHARRRASAPAMQHSCFFPVGAVECPAPAQYGDSENGVAIFCAQHRAPYHVDVSLAAQWASSEGAEFVAAKRKRTHLVRFGGAEKNGV